VNPSIQKFLNKLISLEKPVQTVREGCIPSAVLVILVIKNDELHLLFTHRTSQVKNHKDQVSFPGGVKEEGDLDLIQTAIRETYEEIGLQFFRDEVICQLPDVISPSFFQITPFVSFKETLSEIKINENEVLTVFTVPYNWLSNFHNWGYEDYTTTTGNKKVITYKEYEGEKVWGLTAQIVVNLVNSINK